MCYLWMVAIQNDSRLAHQLEKDGKRLFLNNNIVSVKQNVEIDFFYPSQS